MMKHLSSVVLQISVLSLLVGTLRGQLVTIAVLDFDGIGIASTEAIALSNRLRNELFRLGRFEVVDRGMMTEILNEQGFQQSGCTSNDCLEEVGRLLGAKQMIGGSVSKVGGTFTVSARLVDVETARVLAVSDFDLRGEVDDMLTRGMAQVAANLSATAENIDTQPLLAEDELATAAVNEDSEVATQSPAESTTPSIPKRRKFKASAGFPVGKNSGYNLAVGWYPFLSRRIGPLVVTPALSTDFVKYIENIHVGRIRTDVTYFLAGTSTDIALGRMGFGMQASLGIGYSGEQEFDIPGPFGGFGETARRSATGLIYALGISLSAPMGQYNIAAQPLFISDYDNNFAVLVFNIEFR